MDNIEILNFDINNSDNNSFSVLDNYGEDLTKKTYS